MHVEWSAHHLAHGAAIELNDLAQPEGRGLDGPLVRVRVWGRG